MNDEKRTSKGIPRPHNGAQSASWTRLPRLQRTEDEHAKEVRIETEKGEHGKKETNAANSRSLMQSKDYRSFNRKLLDTVETVGRSRLADDCVPDNLISLEKATRSAVAKLKLVVSAYRRNSVWNDIEVSLKLLQDVWTKINEAAKDLRLYVQMDFGSQFPGEVPSLESTFGESSLIQCNEECAALLKRIIQEAYDVFQPKFITTIELITIAFREEDNIIQMSSISGISTATQAVRLLGMVVETERQLLSAQDEQYRLVILNTLLNRRKTCLKQLVEEKCRYLESLQRTLFQPKHLCAKGKASISGFRNMAEMMKNCWNNGASLLHRLRKVCPELREIVQLALGHVVYRAGSLIAEMQDSEDVQAYLIESEPIQYDDNTIKDIVRSQLWLLPCVKCVIKIASQLTTKLKLLLSQTKQRPQIEELISDLKRVMYDMVMVTIARASWLISWTVHSHSPRLHDLEEQGTQSLLVVYNYNKGDLSLRCTASSPKEDMDLYGVFVYCTNTLRSGVLQVHGMIQKEEVIATALGQPPQDPETEESEEIDTIKFHPLQGTENLKSQLSLKAFPVMLEGSLEAYIESRKSDLNLITAAIDEAIRQTEPVLSDKDDSEPTGPLPGLHLQRSYASTGAESFQSEGVMSVDSIYMSTGFASMDINEDATTETSNAKKPLVVSVPSTEIASGPSRKSPFLSQMPSSTVPSASNNATLSPVSQDLEPDSRNSNNVMKRSISHESSESGQYESATVYAEELTEGQMIGKGAAGTVFKMSYHPRPVAVKIMSQGSLRNKERFKKETRLHSKLSNHPNIVGFVGTCKEFQEPTTGTGQSLVMIMELCDSGDLFKALCDASWIQDKLRFGQNVTEYGDSPGYFLQRDWSLRIKIACDISAGMAHMHSQSIVHRDLTSYNVVLKNSDNERLVAKVCDFERSREVPSGGFIPRSDTFANSPAWASPEIIDSQPYSLPADVYSMGVILWELVTLENPIDLFEEFFKTEGLSSHGKRRGLMLRELKEQPDLHFDDFECLKTEIAQCLAEEPNNRPCMRDLHASLLEIKNSIISHENQVQQ